MKRHLPRVLVALFAPLAPLAAACGDDPVREGSLEVTIYGGPYVEDRIPVADVADGWTIDFVRFLVVVDDVELARGDRPADLTAPEPRVFDLTKPSNGNGHILVQGTVPGGIYDATSFTLGPLDAEVLTGNATASDVALMRDNGYAVFVQGLANKGGVQKSFGWGFTANTRYAACESAAKIDGGTATVQITLHAERLFLDALPLDAETAALRFDAFALADEDGDENGDITLAELAAVGLAAHPEYQLGDRADITDLAAFVAAQVRTLGHVDGDGVCAVAP